MAQSWWTLIPPPPPHAPVLPLETRTAKWYREGPSVSCLGPLSNPGNYTIWLNLLWEVRLESRFLTQWLLLIQSSYGRSQVTENEEIQISSDCKIRITAIKGRNFLSDGVLHYARLRTEGQSVLDSKSRSGIHKPVLYKELSEDRGLGKVTRGD